jgi:hypothetical protein
VTLDFAQASKGFPFDRHATSRQRCHPIPVFHRKNQESHPLKLFTYAGFEREPFFQEENAMKTTQKNDFKCYYSNMDDDKSKGRKIGYVRVSDKDQSENLQVDALKAAGCNVIYGDHGVSGKIKKRVGLDDMLNSLKSGDTLAVWKLDRLGRSTIHLLQLLSDLRDRGVDFQAITQGIDTTTAVGRMLYGQLAVFAEYGNRSIGTACLIPTR